MAYASVGTDTGGSIRIPAAACGLVGLKPTIGELPLDGVVPLSSTLDHVGPICRSVADAHLLHRVLAGETSPAPLAGVAVRGLRLGVLRSYFMELLEEGVASAFDEACARVRAAGVDILERTVPHAADAEAVYPNIAVAEAASYHADTLQLQPDLYTPNVRIRLEMGTYILAEDYVRALRGRDVLRAEVDSALAGCDALLLPALALPAPQLGQQSIRVRGMDLPVRTAMLRLTQLFNISGHPAVSIPCGRTGDGLPAGAQLVGRHGETSALLQLAGALEHHLGPGRSR
jgi:aspartyl-tRNA(Asn)/glutamyl-tRNA(Gln) amidotransferase subunit A